MTNQQLQPSEMLCDFCLKKGCLWMFENPEIKSPFFQVLFMKGQFAACNDCASLLESCRYGQLVTRIHKLNAHLCRDEQEREEFIRIYKLISTKKEICTTYNPNEEN